MKTKPDSFVKTCPFTSQKEQARVAKECHVPEVRHAPEATKKSSSIRIELPPKPTISLRQRLGLKDDEAIEGEDVYDGVILCVFVFMLIFFLL